jgi:hypothetical protein
VTNGNDIAPYWRRSFTTSWRRAEPRTYKVGQSGSPYLTPFLQKNCSLGTPFNRMEEVPVDKIFLTHMINLSSNPLYLRIWRIASCSIVSKALENPILK